MTDIQIEGGEVLANLQERTITGLLIPFNEIGRTNVGRFQVEAGVIRLPEDPEVVSLNLDHNRFAPVGRAVKVWEEPVGVMATFRIAKTPAGDAALADALSPTGKRRALSAEFETGIKAGKATGGVLAAGALVEAGAFASAQVLAADTPDEEPAAETPPAADGGEHIAVEVPVLPEDITATTPAGDSAVYTPEAAPAEENPEGAEVTAVLAGAQPVPTTLITPSTPTTALEVVEHVPVAAQVFAAVATLMHNPGNLEARQVLAELTDIKVTGDGALPGTGVLQPNWVGELNQGVDYQREYVTLGKLGTQISIAGKKGFSVKRGTTGSPVDKFDGTWAGNKAAVNSYSGFSLTVESTRRNFAIAEDVAREFYDLPGGAEVVEAFFRLIIADYYRQTDEWALQDWQTAAGLPVTPATAKYAETYPAALGMILQGILAVKKKKADGRRDNPSFAIANEVAYEELIYAAGGAENLPAFVKIALTTASNGEIDGNVQIVEGETGIEDTASAIVGAGYAIEFDELPGGPLQINALNIANGGIDKAVHGYLQTFMARPEAVVLVGTAEARANTTAVSLWELVKRGSNTYRVVVAGTTAGSAPTEPAVGATVVDGTATLLRLA
jgi:hypothetical protein